MRLFLAADLGAAVRERLAELQRRMAPAAPGWRWTRPESVHLTLRFLGEVDADRDRQLRQGWTLAAAQARSFVAALGDVGRFPPRGRARVLWVGVEEVEPGGQLAVLADAVELAARSAGFEPSRRPFRPHLTLARARRGGAPVVPADPSLARGAQGRVEELILFRSELAPSGARYTALDRFPLRTAAER